MEGVSRYPPNDHRSALPGITPPDNPVDDFTAAETLEFHDVQDDKDYKEDKEYGGSLSSLSSLSS
jgi:hypothetical protein